MTHLVLWGLDPLDYLAGLGLLRVAPTSVLAWGDFDAEISIGADDLTRAILDEARQCSAQIGALVEEAERAAKVAIAACMPDTGQDGRNSELETGALAEDAPPDPDATPAPAAASEIRREKRRRQRELEAWSAAMAKPRIGLDMLSGQQSLASAGQVLTDAITADDVASLLGASCNRARPLKGAMLRLSHTDGTPYAHRATAPGSEIPQVRVAASWLAWRAIVALPLLASRYATAPHPLPSAALSLDWALWREPLGWGAASVLAMATTGRHYSSRISVDKYGYGSLSPATCIAPH